MVLVTPNINIFNLYSFLNVSGYDEENNKGGMHPVRIKIRDKLYKQAKNTNLSKYKDYYVRNYVERDIHLYHFNACALSYSTEGGFTTLKSGYSNSLLKDLNVILKNFYNEFGIDKLYVEYLPFHKTICDEYEIVSSNIIKFTQSHIKEKPKPEVNITIIPNLLESYYRSKSILIDKGLYLVFGPFKNNEVNKEGVVHEYIHLLVNPVLDSYKELIEKRNDLYKRVPQINQVLSSYNNWQSYFSESVVRAVTLFVSSKDDLFNYKTPTKSLENLNRQGFIFSESLLRILESMGDIVSIQTLVEEYLIGAWNQF